MSGNHTGHGHGLTSTVRLAWALGITGTVLAVEVVGAYITGSLALLADAGHMLVDSAGLVIALIAAHLMRLPRSAKRTWGYARAEVVAAALQALLLLLICIMILREGISRLSEPVTVQPGPMLVIGGVGLVANLLSLWILAGGREHSLNTRAAFLEVLTDALGSVAVIVAAAVLWTTGWPYADSVASVLIALMILPRSWKLLRESVAILMETTPPGLDLAEVERCLGEHPDVESVHDLHARTVGTGLIDVTAHVVLTERFIDSGGDQSAVLADLQSRIKETCGDQISHLTVQLDSAETACEDLLAHKGEANSPS